MWTASCQTVVPRHTGKGRYSTLPLILTWTLSPEVGRGNNPQSQFGKMTFTVAFAPVVLFLHLTLITGLRRPTAPVMALPSALPFRVTRTVSPEVVDNSPQSQLGGVKVCLTLCPVALFLQIALLARPFIVPLMRSIIRW